MGECICSICRYCSENNGTRKNCDEYRDSINKDTGSCGYANQYFKPIESKPQPQPKYKLTEEYSIYGFSLVELLNVVNTCGCQEAESKFCKLLTEYIGNGNNSFTIERSLDFWMKFKTIQNNLPWLIEHGFLEEDVEAPKCLYCGHNMIPRNGCESTLIVDAPNIPFYYFTCEGCESESPKAKTKEEAINRATGRITWNTGKK